VAGKILSSIKRLFGQKEPNSTPSAIYESRDRSTFVDAEGRPYAPINDGTLDRFSPKLKIKEEVLNDIRSNMVELDKTFRSAVDLSQFSTSGLSTTKTMLAKMESDVGGQLQLEEEGIAYRNRIAELEKELGSASLRHEEQAAIIHSTKSRLEDTRNELEIAKSQIANLTEAGDQSSTHIQHLGAVKSTLENEIQQARSTILQMEEQNSALEERIASAQAEIRSLRDASISFEKEANECKRMNDNNAHRLESTQSELRELRTISTDFQREKIDFESQLQMLKSESVAANQRVVDQLHKKDTRIYALEARNESLEAGTRIAEQKLDLVKSDNTELEKANVALQKQVDVLKAKVDATRRSQDRDRKTIYKSGDRISELDLNISATIADLNEAIAEKQAYAKLAEELQQKNSELTDRVIRLGAIEERHEQLIRAIREKSDKTEPDTSKTTSNPVTENKTPKRRKSA